MRLSCQTEQLSTALPAFLQSLRYVSPYVVAQLPFICPRYRLPLRRRLWSPLLLSCFFLVWCALRKFTLTFTSGFMSVRLFLIFSFSFLGCISLHAALLSFLSIRLCSLSLRCFECCRLRFVSLYWEHFFFVLYYVPSPVSSLDDRHSCRWPVFLVLC